MIKLCLMASHGYPPGLVLHQELSKFIKDSRPYLANPGTGQEIIPAGSFNPRPNPFEEPWKPISSMWESNQLVEFGSAMRKPVLIDVQDTRPDSLLFCFGIAEECARQEKVFKFLTSESNELEKGEFDLSKISGIMGLQTLKYDEQQPYASSVLYVDKESEKPALDFIGDMARSSKITVQPDGQVLFMGSRAELRDMLSIVSELYVSRNSMKSRKLSPLVPQFAWLDGEVQTTMFVSPAKYEAVTIAPLKSPEKTKLKPSPKRKNSRKTPRERDLYKRNSFHACESLLSLMINKNIHEKTAVLSLKKSGSELPELLTQFSVGIAGTGLAVILSVVCNLACGRVPFCAAKVFNTGLGFGLIWLSWAVNKLRDTIVNVNRNAAKPGMKDEEMMSQVERSIKDVYFRAVTVMAVVVLRFA